MNLCLPEAVLKLTLKRFFHRSSHPSEAGMSSNQNDFAKARAFILNILELIGILLCLAFFNDLYIAGLPSSYVAYYFLYFQNTVFFRYLKYFAFIFQAM